MLHSTPQPLDKYLQGLKVVELASVLAGPLCGTFFAELGARVIKIENPETGGDISRQWKTVQENASSTISAYYASANTGKEIQWLNARNIEDYRQITELIKSADIVIANFKSGDAQKLKLDYETLKKINTQLIYAEITGFGDKDTRTAFDVVLQAETGYMSMCGYSDQSPAKMPVALIDVLAAHQLKEVILLAIINRNLSNEGCYASVSLYDTAIASLANQASNYLMNGYVPVAMGSAHPNIAPYGDLFLTSDEKYFVPAIGNDKHFKLLCQILEAAELTVNDLFLTNALRVTNRQKLLEALGPLIRKKTSGDLLKACINQSVPSGVIKNLEEVFDHENAMRMVTEEIQDSTVLKKVKTISFNFKN